MPETANTPTPSLADLGWTGREEALFAGLAESGFTPARVTRVDRGLPLVATGTAAGTVRAEPAMHLVKTRGSATSRAVVGDWVALAWPEGHEMPVMETILPRRSAFVRKSPGEQTEEQVLIANIDVVFVVQSLSGRGINVRRLERELVMAWESGARPVVVLTKDDIAEDTDYQRNLAEQAAARADVIVESAITGVGIEDVRKHIGPGVTAVFLGGSGVGKSTLVNKLVGADVQETGAVRAFDDKGRHTTVAREIVLVPGGGVIIDTPGIRGIALWDAEDGIASAFPDIDSLAEQCRFADCLHGTEPGCAVTGAVAEGLLPARRLESYRQLSGELADLERRRDDKAHKESERSKKILSKTIKRYFEEGHKSRGRG
ncbi:MAG: ribosome small subunit-dependent GTPase A [Coriobacteriia bacterium]|nr:ribosome small subunit-dependent GTPase A [Coriobacteriia bacterium]